MLPDYLIAKDIFQGFLLDYLQARINYYNPLSIIPSKSLKEGDGTSIIRENGESEVTDLKRISAADNFSLKDIPNQTMADILARYDKIAQSFAKQQFELIIKQIEKATTEVGNVVHGPFSPELFFEMTRKRLISFDKEGRVIGQTMLLHPDNAHAVEEVLKKIENDPALKKEYDLIIEEKKREWNDRENNRRLVD